MVSIAGHLKEAAIQALRRLLLFVPENSSDSADSRHQILANRFDYTGAKRAWKNRRYFGSYTIFKPRTFSRSE